MHGFPEDERPVRFRSILFDRPDQVLVGPAPGCFSDLSLDQVVSSLCVGREEYQLAEFFHTPLHRVDAIAYRHEGLPRPADQPGTAVCHRLRAADAHHARAVLHREGDALSIPAVALVPRRRAHHQQAVVRLAQELTATTIRSRGLRGLADYLAEYTAAKPFTTLTAENATVTSDLAAIRYSLAIRGDRVRVSGYDGEDDYTEQMTASFARYAQGAVRNHRVNIPDSAEMNHVEAAVLDLVAKPYPQPFQALTEFCRTHAAFVDPVVADFDRQAQFYLTWLEHTERLARNGLAFCYPHLSEKSKVESVRDTFGVALAEKLVRAGETVVCNDFNLSGTERILAVTGPNQGGKTTFARTSGQLHHLA